MPETQSTVSVEGFFFVPPPQRVRPDERRSAEAQIASRLLRAPIPLAAVAWALPSPWRAVAERPPGARTSS